jgi:acyl-CoA thioester hydrolase
MKGILIGGKRFVHETEIRVRFNETDANKHVSQVSYVIYFEQARTDFIDTLATDTFEWWSPNYSLVLARQSISYLAPAFFHQTLKVYTGVTSIGQASLNLYHLIIEKDHGTLIANQDSTVVLWDQNTQKSRAWPQGFRDAVQNILSEDTP